MNIVIITAGGVGSRLNKEVPKQFLEINNKPLLVYTLETFQNHPEIDEIICVCLKNYEDFVEKYREEFKITKLKHIIAGGETNQQSIFNGIQEAKKYYDKNDIILIQDGNRPFTSAEIISEIICKTEKYDAAATVIDSVDALSLSDDNKNIIETLNRNTIKRLQTPQSAKLWKLDKIYSLAKEKNITNSVTVGQLLNDFGEKVSCVKGSKLNIKITEEEDLLLFQIIQQHINNQK